MDDFSAGAGGNRDRHNGHRHPPEDWAENLARTVAHLAAQLTMNQIRLRALASELAARDAVAAPAVQARVDEIAATETGRYLRENLGEALVEVVDVDELTGQIVDFLRHPE